MMNTTTRRVIGNSVGKVVLVDANVDGSAMGGHLRVKVGVDIQRPLMCGIMVKDEVSGEE